MSFDELINLTIQKMQEDIKTGKAVRYRPDGSYIIFGEDGDTLVSDSGVEYRTIEQVRRGEGF